MKFRYDLELINNFIDQCGNMTGYSVKIDDFILTNNETKIRIALFSEGTFITPIRSGEIIGDRAKADLAEVVYHITLDISQNNFHLGQISKASEIKDVLYINRDYDN